MSVKSFWGNATWNVVHTIAYLSTLESTSTNIEVDVDLTLEEFYDFLSLLQHTLPCDECKVNVVGEIEEARLNPELNASQSPLRISHFIHNNVNRRLGKLEPPYEIIYISFEERKASGELLNELRKDIIIMLGCMALAHKNPSPESKKSFVKLFDILSSFGIYESQFSDFLEVNDVRYYLTSPERFFYFIFVFSTRVYLLFQGQRYNIFRSYFEKNLTSQLAENGDSCSFCG